MVIESNPSLQSYNSFGILARAQEMLRVSDIDELQEIVQTTFFKERAHFVLGGGTNLVLTGDVKALVLKVELKGKRLVKEDETGYWVEAMAGENWHDFVTWTLDQGWPGLENMALIPGSVGASPVQNIGAYGVELQDRFFELDALDLTTGKRFRLDAAQCAFGYRDSIFKHGSKRHPGDFASRVSALERPPDQRANAQRPLASSSASLPIDLNLGLANRALITHVRFFLPKRWRAVLEYQDLQKKCLTHSKTQPSAKEIYDWVCDIRREKLPDPQFIGNVGSFFKNPSVSSEQCKDIIAREPSLVHYPLLDGRYKLAAGWLIDACGWRGKSVGMAAVYHKQALVLINKGGAENPCTGGEVMTLARAIQTSVYERFGILLEPEPMIL
jgi:UDP-N-acetylmuramate dehydrogenase